MTPVPLKVTQVVMDIPLRKACFRVVRCQWRQVVVFPGERLLTSVRRTATPLWSSMTSDQRRQGLSTHGCGSKPMGSHVGIGAPPIVVYFSGDWMFTGGTIWVLTHGPKAH